MNKPTARPLHPKPVPILEPLRSTFEPCFHCQGPGCLVCDYSGLVPLDEPDQDPFWTLLQNPR